MQHARDEHPNFADTLAQLRAVADGRSSAPEKTEQHPDAELLQYCAAYLDLCAEIDAIYREARKLPVPYVGNPDYDAALARGDEKKTAAKRVLGRLGKMHASTAAGIFAKATIVVTAGGYMTAPKFILSLATDLVSNPTGEPLAGGDDVMPQHLWERTPASRVRVCEVCLQIQIRPGPDSDYWFPSVPPICPGDPDDSGRRATRPRPHAPSGAGPVLDEVLA